MGKLLGWVLMAVVATCGHAQATGAKSQAVKLSRWDAVESLKPGAKIEVVAGNGAGADVCVVSGVEDSALRCTTEDPANPTQLVFRRDSVRGVRVWEAAPNRHVWRWILLGVALGVGTAVLVEGDIVFISVCGLVLLLAEGAPLIEPPRPPTPPRMRWRPIYQSATP